MLLLGALLAAYGMLECFVPLGTAIQIGADEGFNLAKATLCLKGFKLYSEVWNDQPPLHTFLLTHLLSHTSASLLVARLLTVVSTLVLLASIFLLALRVSGLGVAALLGALVIASPGFIELSSSCMLEMPALAIGIAALSLLAVLPDSKYCLRELVAGLVFGAAVQIKLAPALLLPLAAMLVVLPCWRNRTLARRIITRGAIFGVSLLFAWMAIDLLTGRWAYLLHLRQSWESHFTAPHSAEFGSPADHPFAWGLLLRNWDVTLPAVIGIAVFLWKVRTTPAVTLPLAWLTISLAFFAAHQPWWAYYYIHIAVPLCWCAAVGIVTVLQWGLARRTAAAVALSTVFLACALSWMMGRVGSQILDTRRGPQTYSSLLLVELERFRPHTEWLYTEDLVYSFHATIPVPPPLAVLSLKRLWSGDLTAARIAAEVAAYKPGVILLRNHSRAVPFQDLMDAEYRLVYEDDSHRLFAHRTISRVVPPP